MADEAPKRLYVDSDLHSQFRDAVFVTRHGINGRLREETEAAIRDRITFLSEERRLRQS